jgi:hypothetical protein
MMRIISIYLKLFTLNFVVATGIGGNYAFSTFASS